MIDCTNRNVCDNRNTRTLDIETHVFYLDFVRTYNNYNSNMFTEIFSLGTSSLSAPIMFTTAGQESGAAAAPVGTNSTASAVGVAVACILVAAILLAAGFYYRYRKVWHLKSNLDLALGRI